MLSTRYRGSIDQTESDLKSLYRLRGIETYCGCKGKKGQSRHLVIWYRNHEYSILLRKDLWSYYQGMGSEFRHALGKVLGTQDRPTWRLASHYYVLRSNLIKNMFNTCIYTHTHASMYLTYNMASFIPKHIPMYQPKAKESQMQRKPYHSSNIWKTLSHIYDKAANIQHSKANILQTLIIHLSMFHHIIKVKP